MMRRDYQMKCSMILAFCLFVMSCLTCFGSNSDEILFEDGQKLSKVANRLYETTYTRDYDWGDTQTPNLTGFACSAVQNGPYRGRNYDWTYADTDLCVIHTELTENRPHSSVGVADMGFILNADGSLNEKKLPFVTVDGINDAGVCIQVNVMPGGETGELNHTEETEDDLPGARVVRYVLDYADSVDDALDLLGEKDIYSAMGAKDALHWMISGPANKTDNRIKTVVAEVFPDGLHVTEDFVDGTPIMTNFNVASFDGTPQSVGIGQGYERWQILKDNFDQADSVMGTFDLMEKVYYTKTYDLYGDCYWYSENNGTDLLDYYDAETLKNLLGEETYNEYMETYGGIYYNAALWDGEPAIHGDISKTGILAPVVQVSRDAYLAQDMDAGDLWVTIHTSVYDLENKTLDLQVRESQEHLRFTIENPE